MHPKHGTRTPWNVKAEMLKKLYNYVHKEHKFYKAPTPQAYITSLAQIWGPRQRTWGFKYRPKLMMGEGAELNIAMNAMEFKASGGEGALTRKGAVNHIITYVHTGVFKPHLEDTDIREVADELQHPRYFQPRRRRLRFKQPPL